MHRRDSDQIQNIITFTRKQTESALMSANFRRKISKRHEYTGFRLMNKLGSNHRSILKTLPNHQRALRHQIGM